METNEKKKSHILKIICFFIILIVIAVLARFAWAKYIQLDGGNANAQVAKWHFDLQNSKGEYASVSDIDFPITRDDGNESVLENKLAPGTSGKFEMIVDTTGTQVQTMYDIQINLTDCPTNLRFYTDSGMSQELEKVQIGNKMVNGQNVRIHKLTLSRYLPLSIVNNKHTETLYWKWPMETGKTQAEKDKNDLEDSKWINRDTMTMDIFVTGKQVIDEPSPVAIMSVNTQNQNGSTSSATINKQDVELCDAMNVNVELGESSESTSTFNVSMTNLSDSTYYFHKSSLVSLLGEELNSDSIDYKIEGIVETKDTTMGTKLIPGSTLDFNVVFKYKDGVIPSSSNGSLNAVIKFELKQAYNIAYLNFDDASDFPDKVLAGGTATINMPAKIAKVKVTTNNALMIQDDGYTYNENVLKIPNVQGNIVVEDTGLRKFEGVNNGIVAFATRETSTGDNYGDFGVINNVGPSPYYGVYYNDNDGKLKYDSNGSLELDEDNAIAGIDIANVNLNDEYSVYITVKGNTNQQGEPTGYFAGTILAISEISTKYLTWFGFNNNYFNIHSFHDGEALNATKEMSIPGFASFDITEYDDKILNIQITAVRGETTKVYFNGVKVKEFPSGQNEINYKSITIGDLRTGRGLKFTGNIYDLAFYSRALTEDEVKANWKHAKETWNIK